ncbi:MAG: PilZ domain-containing protein [Thermoanaerobaculia bacterium]|nr:PilZ domain-containing protein [Thermoanaerobaculia bacterium]
MSDERPKKRRFPRIASEHVALVRATGAVDSEGFAKTRSLGLGGCSFVTDAALAVGDGVELLLSLAGRAVSATARVVYRLPEGDRHEIGVEFVDVDPADLAFLKSRLPDNADVL